MRIECPFSIDISYVRILNKLVIKQSNLTHNHETNKELYSTLYPNNRLGALKKEDLEDQIALEPKLKKLKLFLEKKYNFIFFPGVRKKNTVFSEIE